MKQLHIAVCLKQVPEGEGIRMDPETHTLIREGHRAMLNPFDAHALAAALDLRCRYDAKLTAVSMGIPAAQEILREAIAQGADAGVLLTDRAFAGADTLATSQALALAMRKLDVDVILCGQMATDGDTAQVGPSLAERLGWPHAANVIAIEAIAPAYIELWRRTDAGKERIRLPKPCVLVATREIAEPGFPTLDGLLASLDGDVQCWTAEDIGADESTIGLNGSPTQVVEVSMPDRQRAVCMAEGAPSQVAEEWLHGMGGAQ